MTALDSRSLTKGFLGKVAGPVAGMPLVQVMGEYITNFM